MSVTHDQYRRARHIVNHASVLTLKAIRPNNRGRKTLDPKILLNQETSQVNDLNLNQTDLRIVRDGMRDGVQME